MISVAVYSRDNVFIDHIPDAIGASFQEVLKEAGSGSMKVPTTSVALDRNPDVLAYGNIVKMTVNGHTFAWLIEIKSRKTISKDESAQLWELSGRGVLALLSDAIVYPELIDAQAQNLPIGKDRWFSYPAADTGWYDDSMWDTPEVVVWNADSVEDRKQQPVNWPDESASWMWLTNPEAHCIADTGWFRTTLSLDVTERFDLCASGDDGYSLFVDGQLLMQGSNARSFQRMRIILAPGEHVFAITGTNGVSGQAEANPAGVIMTLIEVDTTEHEVRLHSSQEWRCISGNADSLPGFNPGRVMADLLNEAIARDVDAASAITVTWDDDLDSAGNAWPDTKVNRAFDVGVDLLYVATQLSEQLAFISMDSDLNLRIVTLDAGLDLTTGNSPVVFRKGQSITDGSYRGDGSGLKSSILTLRDGTVSDDTDADALDEHGRREGFVVIGNTFSESQAADIRRWAFEQRTHPVETLTMGVIEVEGAEPFTDFNVGDYILAPNDNNELSSQRIASLALSDDEAGHTVFAPELSSVGVDNTVRRNRWLTSMSNGTLGGDVTSASPTHQERIETSDQPDSANTTRYEQSTATGPADSPNVFYLEKYPIDLSETVFRNGLMQRPDVDYDRVGKAVSMVDIIDAEDEMQAHYAYNILQPAVVELQIAPGLEQPPIHYTSSHAVAAHSSPDGRWHVLLTYDSSHEWRAWRSVDQLFWVSIGSPTLEPPDVPPVQEGLASTASGVVINNDGHVFVLFMPIFVTSGKMHYAKYDGVAWGTAVELQTVAPTNMGTAWIAVADGGYMQAEAGGGKDAWSDDDLLTWTETTSGASGGPTITSGDNTAYRDVIQGPVAFGGYWHHGWIGTNGASNRPWYKRIDVTTGLLATPSTPPSLGTGAAIGIVVLPTKDDPETLYLALVKSGGITYFTSPDSGDNWSTVGTLSWPGGMTGVGVTLGSDGKLHAWGYAELDGVVTVKEANRPIDGSGSWSAVADVAEHEGDYLISVSRGYAEDGSVAMKPKYAVLQIQNGSSFDLWVVNET